MRLMKIVLVSLFVGLLLSFLIATSHADGIDLNGVQINDDSNSTNQVNVSGTGATKVTVTQTANGANVVVNSPNVVNGTNGTNGTNGKNGATGAQGVAGPAGTPGASDLDANRANVGLEVRWYDGEIFSLFSGYRYDTLHGGNTIDMAVVQIKIGKSYEERLIDQLRKELKHGRLNNG